MASRSCPFRCSYCCNSFLNKLYNNNRIRKRSVDNVIQEIKYAINLINRISFINFIDDQFFTSKEWNDEFVRKYKKEINLPFIVRLVPGSFTEDDLKAMKDAGLMFVQCGIQSGSEKTNRMIFNRRFKRDNIIESSQIFSNNKIHPLYDVIIQNDLEDNSDRDATIKLLLNLKKPFSFIFFALTPYPRTPLEKIYKERGIIPRTNPYERGYIDINEKDFYLQLASIIPFTPRFLSQLFFKHSKSRYIRFLLEQYYRATRRLRNRVITAQSKK